MAENKNNCPMVAEYFPSIPRTEIELSCKQKFSIKDISNLGEGFAMVAATIAEAAMNMPNNEGLYRCVFPEGVTGQLAMKKGEDAFLGTIMNESGIVGQARWIPAEGSSIMMAIDPVTLVIASSMMNINKKLDSVQEVQKDIVEFMNQDKEAKLEGAINSLSDIYEKYSFNSENALWKTSQLTIVSSMKARAEDGIVFYRKRIISSLERRKTVMYSQQSITKLQTELQQNFKGYNIAVYLHSYASFLEVVLGGNHNANYLNAVAEKIKAYSHQYRVDYTTVYNQLNEYVNSSTQKKFLDGVSSIGKAAGNVIAKVPVISKGLLDEALIATGDKIDAFTERRADAVMEKFMENREVGIQLFLENIESINQMCNSKLDLLFDKDVLYICA